MNKFNQSLLLASAIVTLGAHARASESLERAFKEGEAYLDARYRYEFIDQQSKVKNAHASTLRTRLGFKSGEVHNVSGVLEFENIQQIGSDNYNDTLNGKSSTHPTVADVENTEINQAFLQFTGIPETVVKAGRQGINIDNQRFIGTVEWRQNNQTFDGGIIVNQSIPDTTVTYGYIYNVNRIFGDDSPAGDWDSDSHILNIANNSTPLGTITGYAYILDFNSDAPAVSSKTFGASLVGKQKIDKDVAFKYRAEFAKQSDHGSNTTNYNANYYHVAPAIQWKTLTTTVGFEVLGSDNGVIGFSTPLATGHKFNGATDKFLTTPTGGLEDRYVQVKYKVPDMGENWKAIKDLLVKVSYHDFQSEQTSTDFGSEYAVYVKKPITKNIYAEAKYARYYADTVSSDTQKFVFGLGAKY